VIAEVIARPSASVLFHGPDITGRFNKRSQFDRPLRKNAAIDEELAELDARMLRVQRNIAAKRRRTVRSRARSSIGGKADNLRYSSTLDSRQSGELEADAGGACATK
jgi:hypothetical protein